MKKIIVSVKDFGAEISNELQTEKIQAAIDYCFEKGGGEVQIPEGSFLTGGIRLRSNVTLHLLKNAVLVASRDPQDYFGYLNDNIEPLPSDQITDVLFYRSGDGNPVDYNFMKKPGRRWNNAIIRAINAENISIIGEEGSIIDGSDCFDALGEESYRGPHAINFYYCNNITLKGYTVKDSANWAHAIFFSTNISVDKVKAYAGHDGIHITACDNTKIVDCEFYTGDDCVAGFANTNVLVYNCVLNSACSAMRFGGTNVLVEKCHIFAPCKYFFRGSLSDEEKRNGIKPDIQGKRNNMLSLFTYYSDFSIEIKRQPGNIIISDCIVENADRFLHFNFSGNERWQSNRPLESICFRNIEAKGVSMPLTAYGDADNKITLTIENSNITFRDDADADSFMHVCNYNKISLKNINVSNFKGPDFIKTWSDGNIEVENLNCDFPEDRLISKTDEVFVCRPI